MSDLRCSRCSQIPSCGCAEYLTEENTRQREDVKRLSKQIAEMETLIGNLRGERDTIEASLAVAREALESVDIYFKALCEQWAANDGRVVSESGVVINASVDIERLCDIAGQKVGEALQRIRGTDAGEADKSVKGGEGAR